MSESALKPGLYMTPDGETIAYRCGPWFGARQVDELPEGAVRIGYSVTLDQ